MEAAPVTVLDALDNAVGERVRDGSLGQMTVVELDEVRDVLTEFWNAQSDPNAPIESDAPPPSFIGGWVGPFWSERMLRRDLSDALLYYPRLLVLDPLADFFSDGRGLPPLWRTRYRRPDGQVNVMATGPDMWRDPFTYTTLRSNAFEAAHRFASIVENLYLLEQPIRGGVIILRSQWPTLRAKQEQLATAVRHDSRNSVLQEYLDETDRAELHLWDTIRGMQATMDLPVVKADVPMQYAPALYYLAKTLAVADATGAQYVPVNQASLGLLRAKYNDAVRSHPSAMLREVSRVVVPSSDIPIREAVAMRASSDDFEDWRLGLQSLQRASANDDLATLHDRVQETLLPRLHDVERGLQTSRLRESFTRAGADVIVDGAVGVFTGLATATQADMGTAVLAGLGGAAGGATLRWMLKQYAPAKSAGAEAVLATLIRSRQ